MCQGFSRSLQNFVLVKLATTSIFKGLISFQYSSIICMIVNSSGLLGQIILQLMSISSIPVML